MKKLKQRIKVKANEILTDEVERLLPKLTKNERKVLATSIVLSGMEFEGKLNKGHFYRSNDDFENDTGLETSSLLRALSGLLSKGLIKRRSGSRSSGASEYMIPLSLAETNPYILRVESDDFEGFDLVPKNKNDTPYIHRTIYTQDHSDIVKYKNNTERIRTYVHSDIVEDLHNTEPIVTQCNSNTAEESNSVIDVSIATTKKEVPTYNDTNELPICTTPIGENKTKSTSTDVTDVEIGTLFSDNEFGIEEHSHSREYYEKLNLFKRYINAGENIDKVHQRIRALDCLTQPEKEEMVRTTMGYNMDRWLNPSMMEC